MISVISSEIKRNAPKFPAHIPKNSEAEHFTESFLTFPNSPAVRNELRRKPARKVNINPAVKNDIMLLNAGPRSVKASMFIPSASFPVIMLAPKAVVRERRRGKTKTSTRIKMQNQTIRILFFAFSVLMNPDLNEPDIFIFGYNNMILKKNWVKVIILFAIL